MWVQGFRCKCWVWGLVCGFWVWVLILGSGFRLSGLGFRVRFPGTRTSWISIQTPCRMESVLTMDLVETWPSEKLSADICLLRARILSSDPKPIKKEGACNQWSTFESPNGGNPCCFFVIPHTLKP